MGDLEPDRHGAKGWYDPDKALRTATRQGAAPRRHAARQNLMSHLPTSTGRRVRSSGSWNLLGTDYIDIIVEAGPATAFLREVRRSGKYALLGNWGSDYADPSIHRPSIGTNSTSQNMPPAAWMRNTMRWSMPPRLLLMTSPRAMRRLPGLRLSTSTTPL